MDEIRRDVRGKETQGKDGEKEGTDKNDVGGLKKVFSDACFVVLELSSGAHVAIRLDWSVSQ